MRRTNGRKWKQEIAVAYTVELLAIDVSGD